MMTSIDIEEMWEKSDMAVHGTVENIKVNWNEGNIYSVAEISVTGYYIQHSWNETIGVRFEGGETNGLRRWVEDQPKFQIGEEVFVFLWRPDKVKDDYQFKVFGSFQGKFIVEGDTATAPLGESFTLPEPIEPPHKANLLGESQTVKFEIRTPDDQTLTAISITLILVMFSIIMKIVKK